MESASAIYVIGVIILLVLAVLWFFLPFAVFGIQPKMEKVLAEAKRTNEQLEAIRASLKMLSEVAARQYPAGDVIKCVKCGKEHSSLSPVCLFCGHRRW